MSNTTSSSSSGIGFTGLFVSASFKLFDKLIVSTVFKLFDKMMYFSPLCIGVLVALGILIIVFLIAILAALFN